MDGYEGTLRTQNDDKSMTTKLISSPFVMLRFNGKSFFKHFSRIYTILGLYTY